MSKLSEFKAMNSEDRYAVISEHQSTMQCDACGKIVPRGQIKSRTAYGIEGDFCAECRGEELEDEEETA